MRTTLATEALVATAWRRDAFAGVGGKPSTSIGIFMTALRYYPNP